MAVEKKISACPLDCFDVCSFEITVEDGRVVKIEGNKAHPITKGYICEKGRKHLERLYSPARLKYPMKKQAGEWKRIGWEEALNTIAEKLKYYSDSYGSLSIAHFYDGGAAGLLKNVEDLFFEQLGGATGFTGSICWGAGMRAQELDFGDVRSHAPQDMLNSRTIVIWGRNPAETQLHFMEYLKEARKNGSRAILIDPIRTATARHCDCHIQTNPGTDGLLALAVAGYIIENNIADSGFINSYIKGYDKLKECLLRLDKKEFLAACGVSRQTVKELAEALALNRPASIHIGYGMQRYYHGGTAVRCIDLLAAITGNIGITGGGANYANRVIPGGFNWNLIKGSPANNSRYLSKPGFGRDIKAAVDPKIKALFISRSNPVLQLPNTNEVLEALESIEFKVVLDHFMTDTASTADMVLPVTYFLEEEDVISTSMWTPYIHYNRKCIDREYECKPEWEIYAELAKRMGITNFPDYTEKQWLDKLLEPLKASGLDMKKLESEGFILAPGYSKIPWRDKCFATASGKFEPVSTEAILNYAVDMKKEQKYRYSLISVHSNKSLHSQHYMDIIGDMPTVYLSIRDAEILNIKSGDTIVLYNDSGELRAAASLTENCRKDVLYIKEGWWLKNGGSINCLTPDRLSDIGEQAAFNECRVAIQRLCV